ncbi:MAG: Gfo/Idh/MocA family oxidoreductase, partial [Candidatus Poribacteria bacterium]|nr:Gfo/Idh/MocA family oxidoreductase [Candidatus Poribacteria bacterium]
FGKWYDVPTERQYTDYREMIEKENLDIVSVATQPEHRAEIVIYAAEHGVKAIYAEKAMAASMEEADAMVEAVERNGVFLNLGTNRRWHTGFDKMKEIIDSGELGALKTLIIYANGTLFNTASHNFDLILRLNSDHPASWVSAHLPNAEGIIDGDIFSEDPVGQGIIQFKNGVTAYALLSPRSSEWEAICEKGSLTCWNNGWQWHLRRQTDVPGWRTCLAPETFPEFERTSSTANLVKDLVHSLDTGEPPRGGVRVAHASTELIFAFMESHLQNGARVELPLKGSKLRLQRDRAPRQPKFRA